MFLMPYLKELISTSHDKFYLDSCEQCNPLEFTSDCMCYLHTFTFLQIIVWFVIPAIKYSTAEHNNNILVVIVLAQYLPRLYLIFPLTYEIVKATGVVFKTAWEGAVYNMVLYLMASHVWY
jgi:hypothetical protein